MPKTIQIGDDGREQVNLALNPLSLTPTITQGGNYRVAVQDTPKTNAATQLAAALRQGVSVYGQAVRLNQQRASRDVMEMTDEDFQAQINAGLDKEGRSLFGYEKAYNEALTSKYYAEVIPEKLQTLSQQLHQDPYQYKDLASFDAAMEDAMGEVYGEAEQLLGDNVFAARANRALKNATANKFMIQERQRFINKLPEITRQRRSDATFATFDGLVDFNRAGQALTLAHKANLETMNTKDAANVTTSSYFSVVKAAISNNEFGRAKELMDALEDGELEVNGVKLFNTASTSITREELENQIIKGEVDFARIQSAQGDILAAKLENEVYALLETDEPSAIAKLKEYKAEHADTDSITIDGEAVTNDVAINKVLNKIRAIENNPTMFKAQYRTNFINQHSSNRRTAMEFLEPANLEALGHKGLLIQVPSTHPPVYKGMTDKGIEFLGKYKEKLESMERELYDSVSSLPDEERISEYKQKYVTEIIPQMKEWRDSYLGGLKPKIDVAPNTEFQNLVSENEEQELIKNYGQKGGRLLAAAQRTARYNEGRRQAGLDDGMIDTDVVGIPLSLKRIEDTFDTASNQMLFKSSEEKIANFDNIRKNYASLIRGTEIPLTEKDNDFAQWQKKFMFRSVTAAEKFERAKTVLNRVSRYGFTTEELIYNDVKLSSFVAPVSVTEIFAPLGGKVLFESFPILQDGSLAATVETVKEYFETPEEQPVDIEVFKAIADIYDIAPHDLMKSQRNYLMKNGYLLPSKTQTETKTETE